MNQTQRVAIVTGGGGGVGAATALMLAQRGYHLAITYQRNPDNAQQVVQACQALGVEAFAMAVNVAEDADCQALVQATHARWGRLDGLANCAGTTTFVPLTDMDAVNAKDFHDIYAVNAIGPFQMARAAAKHMGDGAAIVNVSSLAAETGRGSSYPYVLSKAALNTLTISLARTLAPKIRVNGVMPGMIEGRWMRDGLGDASYERVKKDFSDLSALGKISQPEDIARAVVWLLEPDAVITGQMLKVDAGFTLGRDRNQSR
ncbi:MAG: SDR family oxidoreductase [Betaproteobacteria bacterium]|nr:SDR family oxidoreductase [Betaproteobacteria bacterium]NBY05847.1 SDR family oxidoreductase [Betaproteobacteria bacterium]